MPAKPPLTPPAGPTKDDPDFIYRPWITLRDGRRIYARDRGLAAFKIPRRY
jgi:hypothetical protein